MNKVLLFVLCLLPLSLYAAGVEPDTHQVFLNGKPFSHAILLNGVWAIPLEDIARGAGMNMTLEPALQLQRSTLRVHGGWDLKENKKAAVPTVSTDSNADAAAAHKHLAGVKYEDITVNTGTGMSKGFYPAGQLFKINKDAQITTNVIMHNGLAFVPLKDFAGAFGGVWKTQPASKLAPGAVIQLNFPKDPNAILTGL